MEKKDELDELFVDDRVPEIREKRKMAEDAIADMPEGELRIKAFEVIFAHLLDEMEE